MSSSPTEMRAAEATVVVMPKMGISVAEGTIATWHKQAGDAVADGETICEVTTDKIDVEIPAPAAGVLTRILAEVGETVDVGETIAEIGPVGPVPSAAEPDPRTPTEVPEPGGSAGELDRSGFHSPVVKRIAERHHIDLGAVRGTGVGGRVSKRDLLALIERGETPGGKRAQRPLHSDSPYVPEPVPAPAPPPAPVAAEPVAEAGTHAHREPMSAMRKAIARRMVESLQTSATCTTVAEVDMGAVMAARAALAPAMRERGVSLTPLAFVARAVVDSLAEFPALNASIEGEDLVQHRGVDLGIAVAIEAGLVVPVIRNAERLNLEGLAAAIGAAAGRARDGTLEPDDVAAGTFTITNPGRYGAVMATPIINQPQVAILDLEAIVKRPVVVEGPQGDSIAIRPIAHLPMSWDHRALDGITAARFLGSVRARLEGGAW
ncbi:2-oxo acid dehydrogenase subunit E2 [Thermoleophilia bacterium SCSIO 60948]|nr:2-oxo acid dehydrogenase subunit E2 [Thermoleophilia bacterium SCSIO 60948]